MYNMCLEREKNPTILQKQTIYRQCTYSYIYGYTATSGQLKENSLISNRL